MKTLMWLIPVLIFVAVVAWKSYKSYKKGLMAVLLELGISVVAAVLAFGVTRLFVNPEKVDIFGLGEKLLGIVPADFVAVSPRYEALIRALPTAVAALLVFSALFGIFRSIGGYICRKLNKKHSWTEKCLVFKGHKWVAVGVGLVTAIFILVIQLVPLGGITTVTSTTVQLVETVLDSQEYAVLTDALHGLAESPALQTVDALGSRKLFCELTKARRGDETFSVGEELLHLADGFTKALPALNAISTDELRQDPQAIRDLPAQLLSTPEMQELTAGMLVSAREDLVSSDAVRILSDLLDVSVDRFGTYIDQLTPDMVHADVTTFCQMAAILAEGGYLPAAGEEFDDAVLDNAQLKTQLRAELDKNSTLAQFFTPEAAE